MEVKEQDAPKRRWTFTILNSSNISYCCENLKFAEETTFRTASAKSDIWIECFKYWIANQIQFSVRNRVIGNSMRFHRYAEHLNPTWQAVSRLAVPSIGTAHIRVYAPCYMQSEKRRSSQCFEFVLVTYRQSLSGSPVPSLRPEWLWSPLSLVSNGCWDFYRGGKTTRAWN